MLGIFLSIIGAIVIAVIVPLTFLKSQQSFGLESYFYKIASVVFMVLGISLAAYSVVLVLGVIGCLLVFIFFVFGRKEQEDPDRFISDSERIDLLKIEEEVKKSNSRFLD